jgi:hypothetical protein
MDYEIPVKILEIDVNLQQTQTLPCLSIQNGSDMVLIIRPRIQNTEFDLTGITAQWQARETIESTEYYSADSTETNVDEDYIKIVLGTSQTGTPIEDWTYCIILLKGGKKYPLGIGTVNIIESGYTGAPGDLINGEDTWATREWVIAQGYITDANVDGIIYGRQDGEWVEVTSGGSCEGYLTIANAASTYETISNAASTYITIANAASTYETISNVYAHTSNVFIHFTEGEIDHTNIQNIGVNSHDQIDIDLIRLANTTGENTGDQNLSDYLTESNASSIYLTIVDASNTYIETEIDPVAIPLINGLREDVNSISNTVSGLVPYTGATTNVVLGDNQLSASSISIIESGNSYSVGIGWSGDRFEINTSETDLEMNPDGSLILNPSGSLRIGGTGSNYTLPIVDGSSGQALLTNGSGVVGWSNVVLGGASFQIDQTGGTSDTYGVLAGSVNSVSKTFTVSTGEYVSGSLTVYLNGQLQTQGTAEDWVETTPSSGTFDFITAPKTGDEITASYKSANSTIGNADTLDGYEGSAFVQKANADDITHSDASSWELKNSASDQDINIQINDGGTNRSAITVNGDEGSVTMPRQSYVHAYMNGDQTIANTSATTVVFNIEATDVLGEYNNTTGVFTAKDAGVYNVTSTVMWQNTDANRNYNLYISTGGGDSAWINKNDSLTNTFLTQTISFNTKLTAGQTIAVKVYQSSGGNETLYGTGSNWAKLTITKVS